MILAGIILMFIAINWWDILFIQLLHGVIYVLTSILLVTAGVYLILRFIT